MFQDLIGRAWRRETNRAELTLKGDLSIMPQESKSKMIPLGFDSALHLPCRVPRKIPVKSEAHFYKFPKEGMKFSGMNAKRTWHLCFCTHRCLTVAWVPTVQPDLCE